MTPSFIGRYAIISPGVRPIISFASLPTARILLSRTETATTEGSFSTMPLPGTYTSTVVVPRSMPSFGENEKAMARHCSRFAHFDNASSHYFDQRFLGSSSPCFLGSSNHQNFFEKLGASSHTRLR